VAGSDSRTGHTIKFNIIENKTIDLLI